MTCNLGALVGIPFPCSDLTTRKGRGNTSPAPKVSPSYRPPHRPAKEISSLCASVVQFEKAYSIPFGITDSNYLMQPSVRILRTLAVQKSQVSMRSEGHDVLYVLELHKGGSDEAVLQHAYEEGRLLLTEDKDFGELVYRLKKPAAGIVLIRIPVAQRLTKWTRLKKLIIEQ